MAVGVGRRKKRRCVDQRGQATVELALVLPVVVLLALVILQAGLVAKDFLLVHHAAREAAWAAAVEPSAMTARSAASDAAGLLGDRLTVFWSGGAEPGDRGKASVSYRSPTQVPLVGRLIDDVTLSAEVTVRIE